MTSAAGTRWLRAGRVPVVVRGDAALVAAAVGPLATLEDDAGPGATRADAPLEVAVEVAPAPPTFSGPHRTRFVPGREGDRVEADGLGEALLRPDGRVVLRLRADAPPGDEASERLTVPALAEALRRRGARLLHAAVLRTPDGAGALLVPAVRGRGKTTLSLSLRRHGFALLSDDRGFLLDAATGPEVDPWPEVPRVGDRSLFLLPPHVATGPRDPRTGKAPAPSLLPPRLTSPLPVVGVLLPRLVDGRGGAVSPAGGAAALAAVVANAVVATDPTTTAATLTAVAALLARVPCAQVEVGDDPATLAAAVRARFDATA
ncbi:MAG: hypothetical protein IT460_16045 [Planctomycetes bacterium]|nr:hypothetical protein [Planctomycetota bacterium]